MKNLLSRINVRIRRKKRKIGLSFFIGFVIAMSMPEGKAKTFFSKAESINDVYYSKSSTGSGSLDEFNNFNIGGWSVYRVYLGNYKYGTGYTYNASLIEIDLSEIPDSAIIEKVILHLNVAHVIQKYNNDYKLAILSHLKSSGFTGDARTDYLYVTPSPIIETFYSFYSGSYSGWKQIDVTPQVLDNINSGENWAVFWISPAPWEDTYQIVNEAKGVSVASADYGTGSLSPYLEIQVSASLDGDVDSDGDVDGWDLYNVISGNSSIGINLFAAQFGVK